MTTGKTIALIMLTMSLNGPFYNIFGNICALSLKIVIKPEVVVLILFV